MAELVLITVDSKLKLLSNIAITIKFFAYFWYYYVVHMYAEELWFFNQN